MIRLGRLLTAQFDDICLCGALLYHFWRGVLFCFVLFITITILGDILGCLQKLVEQCVEFAVVVMKHGFSARIYYVTMCLLMGKPKNIGGELLHRGCGNFC